MLLHVELGLRVVEVAVGARIAGFAHPDAHQRFACGVGYGKASIRVIKIIGITKITKVINLRPKELISMLEETAGTSLYNNMKYNATKLIDKKELKV